MTHRQLYFLSFIFLLLPSFATANEPVSALLHPKSSLVKPLPKSGNTCVAPKKPRQEIDLELEKVPANQLFSTPIFAKTDPRFPSRWWVLEQTGIIKWLENGTVRQVADLSALTNYRPRSELGFLSFTFSPNFRIRPEIYLYYTIATANGITARLARFPVFDGRIDPSRIDVIIDTPQPCENGGACSNHNGGHVDFGTDGMLYLGYGDGGGANDPRGNSQNRSNLLGAMIRIDVSGPSTSGNYKIPVDNPFVNQPGVRPEIWAWGLRNPWRWSFDRATNRLLAGDVGQDRLEEVDVITKGGNYGWNIMEGSRCRLNNCNTNGLIPPIAEYPHTEGQSITGGYVYRGTTIPALRGVYIFGDYITGRVWGLFGNEEDGALEKKDLLLSGFNISSFTEDSNGEIYIVAYDKGELYALKQNMETPLTKEFPEWLSETGCFDPDDPSTPVESMFAYKVNAPLWSDGATKRRWLSLPEGGKIVTENQPWTFPEGTLLFKEFSLNGRKVETRMFVHHRGRSWAGYTYKWLPDGSDAKLLTSGSIEVIEGQRWQFLDSSECFSCHNSAAGRALGLTYRQLNRLNNYEESIFENQLEVMVREDFIVEEAVVPDPITAPLVDLGNPTATLDRKALSYLHANCGVCHRSGGPGRGQQIFVDYGDTSLINYCNTKSEIDDLGNPLNRIFAPGSAETSILWLRMNSRESIGMPPVASQYVHANAVNIVKEWIDSTAACPPDP